MPLTGSRFYAMAQALAAALLFGASAPLAKWILGHIEPIPLSAFLYIGSGIGVAIYKALYRMANRSSEVEAKLDKGDIKWLAGAVAAGGIAAPIMLMFSLRNTPGATASLLLNFESVATTLIALLVFREAIGKHIWAAVCLITAASVLLSWNSGGEWGFSPGSLGILGACILWGIDNNLTRNISAKDPLIIVIVKGLAGGLFSLCLALLLKNSIPGAITVIGVLILGSFGYGMSIVLFILAMRNLGAARASAFFATAPFAGMILSMLLFRDRPAVLFWFALPAMAIGAILLIWERHDHGHEHEEMVHEHKHGHDDGHHNHSHSDETVATGAFHSHAHRHEPTVHEHPHAPDIHHRHIHKA